MESGVHRESGLRAGEGARRNVPTHWKSLLVLLAGLLAAGVAAADHETRTTSATTASDDLSHLAPSAQADYAALGLPAEFTSGLDLGSAGYEADAPQLLSGEPGPSPVQPRKRFTKLHLVRFDHVMQLAGNDLIIKVRGPGKRKSLMSFELKF
jgi:hypothetical protein